MKEISEPAERPAAVRALLLAPAIFVCHFLEESPGFVDWFNARVARGIDQGMFWSVNVTALVVTVGIVAAEQLAASSVTAIAVVAWLSFLMAANAAFHIVAALSDGAYVPGLVTAILLYLPYYAAMMYHLRGAGRLPVAAMSAAAAAGALPMLVHGYLIVFRGSRLF